MFPWKKFLMSGVIANILVVLCAVAALRIMARSTPAISVTLEAPVACREVLLPIRLGERLLPQSLSPASIIHPVSVVRVDGGLFPLVGPLRLSSDRTAVLQLLCTLPEGARERLRIMYEQVAASDVMTITEDWWDETSGSNGHGILSWEARMSEGDGHAVPWSGAAMLRVSVQAAPDAEDCYTNEIIQWPLAEPHTISADAFLCYALRLAGPSAMRISVQPVIEGEAVILEGTVDQDGRDAGWATPLEDVAINRWYYRRVPVGNLQGRLLTGFTVFTNDDPSLSAVERQQPIVAYIDALHVEEGPLPLVSLSNPLREFLAAAHASRSFLLFFGSLLAWNLTAIFVSWRDSPSSRQ